MYINIREPLTLVTGPGPSPAPLAPEITGGLFCGSTYINSFKKEVMKQIFNFPNQIKT